MLTRTVHQRPLSATPLALRMLTFAVCTDPRVAVTEDEEEGGGHSR
jgi:hypothetical protein